MYLILESAWWKKKETSRELNYFTCNFGMFTSKRNYPFDICKYFLFSLYVILFVHIWWEWTINLLHFDVLVQSIISVSLDWKLQKTLKDLHLIISFQVYIGLKVLRPIVLCTCAQNYNCAGYMKAVLWNWTDDLKFVGCWPTFNVNTEGYMSQWLSTLLSTKTQCFRHSWWVDRPNSK